MISTLIRGFGAFCLATVLTQMILFGYFLAQGSLNGDTMTQVIALLNGIDISGNRLQKILKEAEDREQPDFDEILEARRVKNYDTDMRLRSQSEFRDELSQMLAELTDERTRFDDRVAAFNLELDELRQGAQDEGLQNVKRMIQSLDADQAKQQLLKMYDDKRIDDVVTIIQGMSTDKRKDILAEFVTPDEADKLAEILRLIGDGMPTTSLINQASENR